MASRLNDIILLLHFVCSPPGPNIDAVMQAYGIDALEDHGIFLLLARSARQEGWAGVPFPKMPCRSSPAC